MQKIKIQGIDAESFAAAFACLWHFPARRIVRINFRNYKDAWSLFLNRFAYNLFRATIPVHLCGVDQTHAELNSQTECRNLTRAFAFAFAHVPRALAKRRNTVAIA